MIPRKVRVAVTEETALSLERALAEATRARRNMLRSVAPAETAIVGAAEKRLRRNAQRLARLRKQS
jgi:hypothetical protein